jgi:phosphatidylglycerol:prolipoprotein diacylglycerol transferase
MGEHKMHPVLLKYQLSADFLQTWGPQSKMSGYMAYWIIGILASIALAWWGLAPRGTSGRKALGWLGVLLALAFGAILGGIALSRLQFLQLHTYGVLVAVGFLIGIILAVREANRVGENSERILDLAFWLLIAAMLGARLGYIFTHWGEYVADFSSKVPWYQWKIFRLWEGGLLFFGGFVMAILVCLLFVKIYKINFWKLADLLIPSVAIGHFFGQIGGLAAGFGYGKPTELPWQVVFKSGSAAPIGVGLHPTQLYEALGVLAIFFILLWIRSNKSYNGQVFLWYLLLYPALSFFVELFQGDACLAGITQTIGVCRAMIFHADLTRWIADYDIMSWSQLFAICTFVFAIIALIVVKRGQTPPPLKTSK